MVALNTIYQLRHFQQLDGQDIENIYFYRHAAGTGVATDLALDFEANVLPLVRALQVSQVTDVGIQAYNLGDLGDFVNLPVVGGGTYGSVPYKPSFVAVGFSMKVNTRAVRQGSKRISGVPTEVANGDTITSSGYIAAMEALRLQLGTNLTGGGDTFTPIVVKRVKTLVAGTTPPKYKYNLPVPPATDATVGDVVAVLTSNDLTSQVSRKK